MAAKLTSNRTSCKYCTVSYVRKELNSSNSSGAGKMAMFGSIRLSSYVIASVQAHGNVMSPWTAVFGVLKQRPNVNWSGCSRMRWRSAGLGGAHNSSARTRACEVTHCSVLQATEESYRTPANWEEHFWSPHSGKPSGWSSDNWTHWVRNYIRLPDFLGYSFSRLNEGVIPSDSLQTCLFRTLRNNHSGYFNFIRHYTRSVIVKE
jgi:hypothetical protein